jgi:hypothetical protein
MSGNKVKLGRAVLVLPALIALLGCDGGPQGEAPTVDWYREHASERDHQVQVCSSDPAAHKESELCLNALRAAELESVGSLRNLPSMGLSPPKAEAPKDPAPAP